MFQKIKFTSDASLIIIENYDEDSDESVKVNENFLKGEEVEWQVIDDRPTEVSIQFEDGAVCFGIPKDLFDVLEENE